MDGPLRVKTLLLRSELCVAHRAGMGQLPKGIYPLSVPFGLHILGGNEFPHLRAKRHPAGGCAPKRTCGCSAARFCCAKRLDAASAAETCCHAKSRPPNGRPALVLRFLFFLKLRVAHRAGMGQLPKGIHPLWVPFRLHILGGNEFPHLRAKRHPAGGCAPKRACGCSAARFCCAKRLDAASAAETCCPAKKAGRPMGGRLLYSVFCPF